MAIFKFKVFLVYIYYLMLLVSCGLKDDRKDWVDPANMLRYDPLNKNMRPVKFEKPHSKIIDVDNKGVYPHLNREESDHGTSQKDESENCDVQYLKRFTQQILNYLPYNSKYATENGDTREMIFDAQISLKEKDYETLKTFLQSPKSRALLNDVDHVLSRLFNTVTPRFLGTELPQEPFTNRLYDFALDFFCNKIVIIIGTSILSLIIPVILLRVLTLRGFLLILFLVLLAVSFAMEYIFLLQEAEANQRFQQSQFSDIPKECQPSQLGNFESVFYFMKSKVLGMEDKCEKYYKVMIVDHKFEITPTTVMSSMIGKMGIITAKMFGESISKFFDKLVEGRSYFGAAFFLIFLTLITVAILWVTCPIIMYNMPRLLYRPRREVMYGYGRQMIQNFPVESTYPPHLTQPPFQQLQPPNPQTPLLAQERNKSEKSPSTKLPCHDAGNIADNTPEKLSSPLKESSTNEVPLSKNVCCATSAESSKNELLTGNVDFESQDERTIEITNLTSTKISSVVIYRECSTQT